MKAALFVVLAGTLLATGACRKTTVIEREQPVIHERERVIERQPTVIERRPTNTTIIEDRNPDVIIERR